MGIFSKVLGGLGSFLGPVGSLVGGTVGGLIDGNKEKKKQQAAYDQQLAAETASTNASIEQTNAWRQENRQWDREDSIRDEWLSRDAMNVQNSFNERMLVDERKYNSPAELRKRAEEAGFNPLALLGSGVGMSGGTPAAAAPTYGGSQNSVGVQIAPQVDVSNLPAVTSSMDQIGEAFGSGLAEYSSAISQATAARQENADLKSALAKTTIRPAIGGIYGGGDVPVQMVAGSGYGSEAKTSSVAESPRRPLQRGADPLIHDERSPVMVYSPSAGKHVPIHAGWADRLELKTGDTIMAEDYEAMIGDVGSEFINLPNLANEIVGGGDGFRGHDGKSDPQKVLDAVRRPFGVMTTKKTRSAIADHAEKRRARGF